MKFSDSKIVAWGTLAGAVITGLSLAAGIVIYNVRLRDDATQSRQTDSDHETRLRTLEGSVAGIHTHLATIETDVKWIRGYLDPQPPLHSGQWPVASGQKSPTDRSGE